MARLLPWTDGKDELMGQKLAFSMSTSVFVPFYLLQLILNGETDHVGLPEPISKRFDEDFVRLDRESPKQLSV